MRSAVSKPKHSHQLEEIEIHLLLEGLYRHYIEDTASNPKANEFEWKVPQLVDRAHRIITAA